MCNIEKLFKDYKENKNYLVEDIIKEESEYIFILESPHNTEIKENYPVAGKSGKSMAKFMGISYDISFGKFVKSSKSKISIMNVSKVPLDLGNITIKEPKYDDLVDSLLLIRTGYESFNKHMNSEINNIENVILKDFKKRIDKFIKNNTQSKLVICGKFAQIFFENATGKDRKDENVFYVPHPSRNNWQNNDTDLNKLKDIFKEN